MRYWIIEHPLRGTFAGFGTKKQKAVPVFHSFANANGAAMEFCSFTEATRALASVRIYALWASIREIDKPERMEAAE